MKRISLLTALAVLALCAPASATVLHVDANDESDDNFAGACGHPGDDGKACDTIKTALKYAVDGDTIQVAPGSYPETVTVTIPNLTFVGAGAAHDGRTRTGPFNLVGTPTDTVVSPGTDPGFVIDAANVTIDGFGVYSTRNYLSGGGVIAGSASHGLLIEDSVIRHTPVGVSLANSSAGVAIRRTLFDDNERGIISDVGSPGLAVENNRFANDRAYLDAIAVSGSTDLKIDGNSFVGGVNITDVAHVQFTNNEFVLSNFAAVLLRGDADVEIRGNKISGNSREGILLLDSAGRPNTGVEIIGNDLTGNGSCAINVYPNGTAGPVIARFNRIVGNGVRGADFNEPVCVEENVRAVGGDRRDRVIADDNWWGNNMDAPGLEGKVDVSNLLLLDLRAAPSSIATGGEQSTVMVDLTKNSDGDDHAAPPLPPIAVALGTSLGTLGAPSVTTINGVGQTTLTSGDEAGTAAVTASLNAEQLSADVVFTAPVEEMTPPAPAQHVEPTVTEPAPVITGPAPDMAGPAPDLTGPAIRVVRGTLHATRTGKVSVSLSCPREESAGCTGQLGLQSRKVKSAAARFAIPAGKLTPIRVKLSKRNLAILRRLRRVRVAVRVVSSDSAGNTTRLAPVVTLAAPRR